METVARDEEALSWTRQTLIRGHDARQKALTMQALTAQREVMPSDHSSGGARWTRGLLQKAEEAGRAAQQLEEFSSAREEWRRGFERDERITWMATEGGRTTAPVYRPSTYGLHTYGTYRAPIKHGRNTYMEQGVPSRSFVVTGPSDTI